jgi:hypothetical protein
MSSDLSLSVWPTSGGVNEAASIASGVDPGLAIRYEAPNAQFKCLKVIFMVDKPTFFLNYFEMLEYLFQ